MKSRITKLAAAALIIIAVLAGIHYSGGSVDPATIAWAAVTKHVAEVDLLHFYQIEVKGKDMKAIGEGWYAHGKLAARHYTGKTIYDDGVKEKSYSPDKTLVGYGPSQVAEGLLKALTFGTFSDDNEEFRRQVPTSVGEDFLIYNFSPPSDWDELETISVTVGRNSLLPVQVKLHYKSRDMLEGDHLLLVFDYEAGEKPPGFFEPPAASAPPEPPHGVGEVVLDGEEVMIDIHNAPGIATAAVRLHRKSSEYSGGPLFSLDVAFITVEGYRSVTNDAIPLGLNEATNCGVGADNWPDGKYRNIRFWPLLKPTEEEDTYMVEIRCWLRTKH